MSKFLAAVRAIRADFAAFRALPTDERGVTALEYALLAAVVATAVIAVGPQIQSTIAGAFTRIATKIATT